MGLEQLQKGDKLQLGRAKYTVENTAPGKLLVKGCGFRKWLNIADLEAKGAVIGQQEAPEC